MSEQHSLNTEDKPNHIRMRNPRTGQTLYEVPCATTDEITQTYDRAHQAFNVIKNLTVKERINEILKLRQYIIQHRNDIIDQNVAETGKDRNVALLEIISTLSAIDSYAHNTEKWLADEKLSSPILMGNKKSRIYYEPVGPVLIITPWNAPFLLVMDGLLPAFLAGNPVILKPSEWSLLHGLFETMLEKSGFIKDAVQVIYGGKETGKQCIDAKPARILFTGSTENGKKVMSQAGEYLIPVILECGGMDPMVVFEDANIDRAVEAATTGGLLISGQVCVSIERLVLHEKIHDEFLTKLKKRFERLTTTENIGNQADEGQLEVGNITTDFQIPKIEAHLQDALDKGANILIGGKAVDQQTFQPTLVDKVDETMRISNEETFGPVIAARSFSTEEEAIKIANEISQGLGACVWSGDLERAERVARQIESGCVSVNNYFANLLNPSLPYGGTKESGVGRYHGRFGLHAFSNIKSVVIDPSDDLEINWFPNSKEKYQLLDKICALQEKKSIGNMIRLLITLRKLKALQKKAQK